MLGLQLIHVDRRVPGGRRGTTSLELFDTSQAKKPKAPKPDLFSVKQLLHK